MRFRFDRELSLLISKLVVLFEQLLRHAQTVLQLRDDRTIFLRCHAAERIELETKVVFDELTFRSPTFSRCFSAWRSNSVKFSFSFELVAKRLQKSVIVLLLALGFCHSFVVLRVLPRRFSLARRAD